LFLNPTIKETAVPNKAMGTQVIDKKVRPAKW
jgi:hypothetical protein